jgi:hypothetical protein
MDEVGPATMQRMKAIKSKLEKKVVQVGQALGIPDDPQLCIAIIQQDQMDRVEDKLSHIQEGQKEPFRLLRNIVRFIDGLLDRFLGK